MINITVNDVVMTLPEGATLAEVLTAKSIEPKGIATAVNGKVVAAPLREKFSLSEGDKVVVIKAFYGG
ncbi:MAG: sulfur carrier protein ThiS [Duncaniella sp.]|nr:sulfur carrier protein ThiS [Duncaniella sp.]